MRKLAYYFYKFLCYALSILLALTIAGCCIVSVFSLTAASKSYTREYFTSDSVTQPLSVQIYEKLDDIAAEYGMNGAVLERTYPYDFLISVQETAMNSLYNGRSATVSNSTNVEFRCKNAIDQFNSAQVKSSKKLSDKEAERMINDVKEAFDSVYEITNSQDFYPFSVFFGRCVKLSVLFAGMSVVMAGIVYFLSGRRHRSLTFIAMSLMSAGGICIAAPSVLFYILDFSNIVLTNIQAYNTAIVGATERMLIILMIVGAVLIVISSAIFISNYKYYSFKLKNSETEYKIEQNLI